MAFTTGPGANRMLGNPNWSSMPYTSGGKKRPVPELTGAVSTATVPGGGCPGGTPAQPAGPGKAPTCPPGTTKKGLQCCPASSAAGAGGFQLPGMPGGSGWTPSNVERPNITPINPNAEYDPEMAASLAKMRGHETNLEQGSGHAMDVLTGRQADQLEAQVAQAKASAAAAGIPFDEAAFRATAMRGINSAMADEKANREKALSEQYKTTGQMAGAQAGERNQRLEQDYKTQLSNNELLLDRYGRDIQKYGVDAQAATAANNALMSFYSQLMGGLFNMMGSGSMSMNNTNYYT